MVKNFNSINSIINSIAGFDSSGKNTREIDTLLEYNKLGDYLSGRHVEGNDTEYSELSANEQTALKNLFESLKIKFRSFISNPEALPVITDENAIKYAEEEERLYYKKNDINGLNDEEKIIYDKIQKALYQYAVNNGEDMSNIKYNDCNYGYIVQNLLERKTLNNLNFEKGQKSLTLLKTPYDYKNLKKKAEEFIKTNNIQKIKSETTDLGNGKFDKSATQQTNVCWAIAGINSLLTTEKGKELLETNCYYDKTTGVFAIHLQEAEETLLHDGIYIVTPEEIANESKNLSTGEGDITAYLIAIKKYFEEIQRDPELVEIKESNHQSVRDINNGNYNFRFLEILTGGQCVQYSDFKDLTLQNGIGNGSTYRIPYQDIYNIAINKNGAAVLAIANHSISVVGAKDGKLLIQESNNATDFEKEFSDKERNHIVFVPTEPIDGVRTYELSEYDYIGYIRAAAFIKW